jgi:hypothetical protein
MDDGCHTLPGFAALVWLNTVTVCTDRWQNWWLDWSAIIPVSLPVLATCGIRRPELACEYTSYCFLLLADSQEAEYNGKH